MIYQVTMVNSLKCLKCTQSMDEDTFFLDIPLSVCSADAAEKLESMEKGLEQFLKKVKMKGDNKFYCNNCEMKIETASDVCNDWCLKLTVNRMNNVDVVKGEETPVQSQEVKQECSEDITAGNPETPQDQSQQISTGEGEKRYELFAIWHHSGSYGSCHYYAEIKSDSGDWYNFNDEYVKKEKDIYLGSKTAYVLMYRLIDTNYKAGASYRNSCGGMSRDSSYNRLKFVKRPDGITGLFQIPLPCINR
ncbi:ubiquitin carboxyl-terminal hydrolase 17-like protein 19 [Mobula birostris]|uniref:ubiquitin carboxyl-terminal hydrolase 17-like protein 19 n=1 Tax=Mobula birostris TaxID=1983395 RepID=UPI003B27DF16